MKLDIDYVRSHFSQMSNTNSVFCCNAGGSYMADQVSHLLHHYNTHTRVQPYERYASSSQAGEAMDHAMQLWAEALNISRDELTIGPSTSMNTYVMAQAIATSLNEGDEIIVTNQDHEANSGVWRRMAEQRNIIIREWRVNADSGLLDSEQLYPLLNENTQWVFFTHCSNIVGTTNPVQEIVASIKQQSAAKVFVDAVAHAPHCIEDLKQLDVDGYVASLYKVYGPHQGIMYVKNTVAETLSPQCHYFNIDYGTKWFNPAGPQHAQIASCAGVIDYFNALHQHHFGTDSTKSQREKISQVQQLISTHEKNLTQPILDLLNSKKNIRLIGKKHTQDSDRAPTIAFRPHQESALALSTRIQDKGIDCESGHFYAHRLISDLGIDPNDGVIRISLVHYVNQQEVEKIVDALDACIDS